MRGTLRIILCVALLAGCAAPYPATAQDTDVPDCLKTPQTLEAKVAACRAAAESGDAEAQFEFGGMYVYGEGVPQDYAEALVWFRRAAEQGLAVAQALLGAMYYEGRGIPQNYVLTHMWLNLAGAGGYPGAGEVRDEIARDMTPAQIADAQRLAQEWTEAHGAGAE